MSIQVAKTNGIATVTLNRPDKLNALSEEMYHGIADRFVELDADDEVRAIVLTGAGRAFCAGGDVGSMGGYDVVSGRKRSQKHKRTVVNVYNAEKPVIAAVNGYALGGGSELALACHIRIASDNAKFGQPEVNLGIIPGYGGTQRLARLVGKGRAMEMILTGEPVDAQEALRIGLVNKVVALPELMKTAESIAQKIIGKGQVAVGLALRAVTATHELSLALGQVFETELFGRCCASEDFKEGTSSFLQKRKPAFKNK